MKNLEDRFNVGVSPAVSVVLMIGVVVALTALITVISFSIVDIDSNESPDASFSLSERGGEVRAVILRNENVESFVLENSQGDVEFGPSVGSTANLPLDNETYFLKASTGSGEQQIVDKLEITSSDIDATTISGSVNINPPIPNATIKIIDQDTGTTTKTLETDSQGQFESTVPEDNYEVLVNATDVNVQIDGNQKNFYGGTWKEDISRGENVQINFDEQNSVNCNINGNSAFVSFGTDSNGKYQVSNKYQTHCIDDLGIEGNYELGRNIKDTTDNGLSDYRQDEILNLDPTTTDTNADGLKDKTEVKVLGTNPNKTTTIYDGFTDKEAYQRSDLKANKSNILVQVSYMNSSKVDISSVDFNQVEQKFSEKGYNLVFDVDDSPVKNRTDLKLYQGYMNDYYNDTDIYTNRSEGYLHMLVVDSIGNTINGNELDGVTSPDPNFLDGMMVKYSPDTDGINRTEHFIMHELGHQLGLVSSTQDGSLRTIESGDAFGGIDDTSSSCADYTSVMNYNCQPNSGGNDFLSAGYSNTTVAHDDWSIINKYQNKTNPINTDEKCLQSNINCSG